MAVLSFLMRPIELNDICSKAVLKKEKVSSSCNSVNENFPALKDQSGISNAGLPCNIAQLNTLWC